MKRFTGVRVFVFILTAALLLSPYSLSFANENDDSTRLYFAASDKIKKDTMLQSNSNSLVDAKKYLDEGELNVTLAEDSNTIPDLNSYSSFAYDYRDVKNNKDIQTFLKEALLSDKKVYLYGGLTIKEFSQLLDVEYDIIVVDEFGNRKKINLSGSNKEKQSTTNPTTNNDKYLQSVIGYSIDTQSSPYQAFVTRINNYDEKGNTPLTQIPAWRSLQEILRHESRNLEANSSKDERGIVTSNTANASTVIVSSSSGDIRATADYLFSTRGEMITQWILSKVPSSGETDVNYDYFVLKDLVQVRKIDSGYSAKSVTVDHALMFGSDECMTQIQMMMIVLIQFQYYSLGSELVIFI